LDKTISRKVVRKFYLPSENSREISTAILLNKNYRNNNLIVEYGPNESIESTRLNFIDTGFRNNRHIHDTIVAEQFFDEAKAIFEEARIRYHQILDDHKACLHEIITAASSVLAAMALKEGGKK
jgi:hypothetical protein